MAVKRDYYEALGLKRDADANAIKKAYRKLAKKYHPDTNAGNPDAEQKFKEITEAYSVLSDPEKKKLYDQFGHAAFDQSAGAGAEGFRNGTSGGTWRDFSDGGYREYHFEGNADDDLFGDLFGSFFHGNGTGGGRNSGFRQGGFYQDGFGGRQYARKGEDLHADISVSFEDAAFGCDKTISLQDQSGQVQSLRVHIPAGIDNEQSVRLRGKGMPGSGGGEAGDLLLKVHIQETSGYERKGMDVYTIANIPYTTAVFGGEARVRTLYGDVVCKIKEGTQSGSKLRLKGKGIVSMKNPSVHGDQYVTIQIQVPRHLNPQERQKLMEYARACG